MIDRAAIAKTTDGRHALCAGNVDTQFVTQQRLQESSYLGLRGVVCEYHEGVLILRGHVPSFYLKQLAQTLVRKVDGVDTVVNRLTVDN